MEQHIYSPDEVKLAYAILDEMQWQYKNWGDNKDDAIKDRLQYVQKHLEEALSFLDSDEQQALGQIRILAGIVFSILQKHPAPQRS